MIFKAGLYGDCHNKQDDAVLIGRCKSKLVMSCLVSAVLDYQFYYIQSNEIQENTDQI